MATTDLNCVSIVGRLTQDLGADERSFGYLSNGTARANITLAINRSRKNGDQWIEDVSFVPVVIWGKTAENLKPYLIKGKQIAVQGFLKQDRWEKNGQKQSRISIVAENVQLLGSSDNSKKNTQQSAPKQNAPVPQTTPAPQNNNWQQQYLGEPGSDFPEDIPF